ncbi:hypothetical protein M0R04_08805 [Candidatus Dojkabacteria bacterium]|jgi:hypothetical protein|nr:hypothetical protein [Candidatus Dojkabacteria bacterium]
MKLNWRFILLEAFIILSSITIGKLSASYEGCQFLYNPYHWVVGILAGIPLLALYFLKDHFFIYVDDGGKEHG